MMLGENAQTSDAIRTDLCTTTKRQLTRLCLASSFKPKTTWRWSPKRLLRRCSPLCVTPFHGAENPVTVTMIRGYVEIQGNSQALMDGIKKRELQRRLQQ
jgi:hypothetical protein